MTEPDLLHDRRAVAGLVGDIVAAAGRLERGATFMEVCGTHTHAVASSGLRRMLPDGVRLISGPGCPVCVTPVGYLDHGLALADLPDVIVCTFGDLMRVPSSTVTLEHARAEGSRIEVVYSPRDALQVARDNPSARVVFLAVGFETTVPTIAAAVSEAEQTRVENFLILSGNKVIPPAMLVLVEDQELNVDGFLLPGHVSVLTGWETFVFLATDHGVPGAVVGFSPTDVLRGVLELISQCTRGDAEVTNLYSRVVSPEGNTTAFALVDRFFETCPAEWRGFGEIPASGLRLREEWVHRDAGRIEVDLPPSHEPEGCRCGDVLRGVIDPPDCPLFAAGCTPDTAIGACMVSSEGTCSAWYRHERWNRSNP